MQTNSQSSSDSVSDILLQSENLNIFQDLLLELLFKGIKIYLDGLGILFTESESEKVSYFCGKKTICREETKLQIKFEKSYELTSFHYSKFPKIMDTHELAIRTLPRLQLAKNIKYNQKDLDQDIKRLFNNLRSELLFNGSSHLLEKLGTFYALKLNSSYNWRDKFSQADICLIATSAKVVSSEERYSYQAPVLKDPCEPLQSFYPTASQDLTINLAEHAEKLGIEVQDFYQDQTIKLKTFLTENPHNQDEEIAIFCTSGIHRLAHEREPNSIGCELVVQASILKGSTIPEWPVNLIVVFWMMILSSERKIITPCSLINFDLDALISEPHCLSGLFTTNFNLLPATYQSLSGRFRYINILGLIEDEVSFAADYNTSKLLDVLTQKDFHQRIRLNRRNIFK